MDLLAANQLQLPGWLAWVIAGGSFVALGIPMVRLYLLKRKEDAEFLPVPVLTPILRDVPVRVRGPDGKPADMAIFAICWDAAFTYLVNHGPWKREQLVARLGPGSLVQVMTTAAWKGANGALVGGELVDGIIHVGPSFDSLCHELAHRAEALIDKRTDEKHLTWQGRGIKKADEAYRSWLRALG